MTREARVIDVDGDPDDPCRTTYKAPIVCLNCGYEGPAEFPLGIAVYQNEAKCPNCRCSSIRAHNAVTIRIDNECDMRKLLEALAGGSMKEIKKKLECVEAKGMPERQGMPERRGSRAQPARIAAPLGIDTQDTPY